MPRSTRSDSVTYTSDVNATTLQCGMLGKLEPRRLAVFRAVSVLGNNPFIEGNLPL